MREKITALAVEKKDLTENEKLLVDLSIKGINDRYADVPEEKIPQQLLVERATYELNIIISMGFANYLLIVSDYVSLGTMIGHMPDERLAYLRSHMQDMTCSEMADYISQDQSYPGMTMGLGRGSAAGSVIVYALQITNLEPISYGLLFERFLNPERVSMPDIDSDFSKAEMIYGNRDIVIEYVSKKYGKDAICSIVTKDTLKVKAAIDKVTSVMMSKKAQKLGLPAKDESLKDEFYALARQMKALVPENVPDVAFDSVIEGDMTVADLIRETFKDNPLANEILDYAIQLEGVNINYGKHAAGVVIADNGDVGEYGALMWQDDDKYKGWKFQMDGPDVENIAGLLKMDFLGLNTLNVITAAVRYIYQNTGVYIDCDHIPEDPKVYEEIFSKANTFGVFQFESAGARKILKNFRPDCFEDLIIINAINRPGPAQYIEPITAKKHGEEVAETAFDKVPCIQDILAPTYGYPVYQEQVMQIFQKMGQYSMGGADEIRRAMSKKKKAVIAENREIFVHGGELVNHDTHKSTHVAGAVSVGIPENFAYDVYDSIQDFAKYGFNKSHAAVYARTAYITAWLKYHYPVEFFTAYLNTVDKGSDNLEEVLQDAQKNGCRILPPDINDSQLLFTCDHEKIRYGFKKIGLEEKLRMEQRSYTSMADFILRTTLKQASIDKLIDAGAFDRFTNSRRALKKVLPAYLKEKENYQKAVTKHDNYTRLLKDMESGVPIDKANYGMQNRKTLPSTNQIITTIESSEKDIQNAIALIKGQEIPVREYPDDNLEKLNLEKKQLKAYISAHPIDIYGAPEKYGCLPLGRPQQGNCKVMGMVTGLRLTSKKSDPTQQLAFFTLTDNTGEIPVCVFAQAYPGCQELLHEGAILMFDGYIKPDTRSKNGALQFVVNASRQGRPNAQKLKVIPYDVCAQINGIEDYMPLSLKLKVYADNDGHPVYVYDRTTCEYSKLDIKVNGQAEAEGLVVRR